MANALFTLARESFLKGEIDMAADDIRAILVDAAEYTPNLATDQFLDDVPALGRVATSAALTGKTTTNGVFDADDTPLAAVTGDQFEYVVLYQHTGVEATSRLIALIDTATNLPATPTGGNVTLVWDSGANKIFKL